MRYFIYLLLVAVSLALLWHFSNIWIYGEHLIQEPSRWVLVLETIGIIAIIAFGIYGAIKELRDNL